MSLPTMRALIVGVVAALAVTTAGCSSSSRSSGTTSTTATTKSFAVVTPNGQASISLDGKPPPNWPSNFPVPSGATLAGSGSLGASGSATKVAIYRTSESGSDAFSYYTTSNSGLTTSGSKSAGAGSSYVGSAKITSPYTGSVTVVGRDSATYIVVVLTNAAATSTT